MVKNVAVIGAGVMGHGIAQSYASAGFSVYIYDPQEAMLKKAAQLIHASLDLFVEQGIISSHKKQTVMDNLRYTTDLDIAIQSAQLITEAVPEVLDIKWDLFNKLEQKISPDVIIASNTSTLPLMDMAKHVKHPERMIITHFFNPAQIVPLVEIVKHEKTTEQVVETMVDIIRQIGKQPVLLQKEVPGFIANRLQAALVREAFYLLQESVASAKDIDMAVTAGPGFRWSKIGPLQTSDFGGLDTWMRVLDNLSPVLCKDETSPRMVKEHVEVNELGVKTGKGLFSYEAGEAEKQTYERDLYFLRMLSLRQQDNE
ncbi:3-hydroxyacyl-CoA dehydrogenase family protein [Brevibacillus daliensis]|uniref:3-hydroxyacyl-CoA dehydrogenase family protein n=1 Tax=Brevibacillus daliensis TaxID=2892995 RepID=UPI001E3120B5|nr:3-hydroxyacyl-CoA dehydrogenase family protein [Brevibacillus daliensis]